MRDLALETYGWCKVTCSKCGKEFNVHPISNADAPDADICYDCREKQSQKKVS